MSQTDKTLLEYRYYCETEGSFITEWREEGDSEPTVCKNSAHPITASSITVDKRSDPRTIQLVEESIETNGKYRADFVEMLVVTPGETRTNDFWKPLNTSILSMNIAPEDLLNGCELSLAVGANSDPIGATTENTGPVSAWVSQNYTSGDSVLYTHPKLGGVVYTCIQDTVSSEVPTESAYWKQGYGFSVSSTVALYAQSAFTIYIGNDDMGMLISTDSANNIIYTENAPANSHTLGALITQEYHVLKGLKLGKSWNYSFGEDKIGGMGVPAGTIIRSSLKNTGQSNVDLVGHVNYLI